jgi:hypothetical protein
MMKFDGILAKAEALLVEHPVRTELTEAEIKRIVLQFGRCLDEREDVFQCFARCHCCDLLLIVR